jgi:2-methylcitrate dehydratase PrpD
MIAGSVTPAGKIVANYVKKQGCIKESGAVGCRFQTNMESAALINGNTGHASELEDDSFPEGCMTYNVIPSVLAVGEALRANGREIIEAFAVGYEIQAKLALHAPGIFVVGHHTCYGSGGFGCGGSEAVAVGSGSDQECYEHGGYECVWVDAADGVYVSFGGVWVGSEEWGDDSFVGEGGIYR